MATRGNRFSGGRFTRSITEAQRAYQRRDYQTALKGFLPLAEKGNPQAQEYLGLMYQFGNGVTRDRDKAAAWYRKAADQGHAPAQYWLGMVYQDYFRDNAEAVKWYRKSAEQGFVSAQSMLGLCYEEGQGVSPVKGKAPSAATSRAH